jgi:phosphatidylglycerophosphate synthase
LIIAIAVYTTHPLIFVFCYVISALLDALDGMAARKLGQSNFY